MLEVDEQLVRTLEVLDLGARGVVDRPAVAGRFKRPAGLTVGPRISTTTSGSPTRSVSKGTEPRLDKFAHHLRLRIGPRWRRRRDRRWRSWIVRSGR